MNKLPTLRELRMSKKLDQFEMAAELKTKEKTYGAWERGYRTPKPADMQRIEDYFGVPKEEIFFEAFDYET